MFDVVSRIKNIAVIALTVSLVVVSLDKTELETAQQFLDQASQQNLVCINIILFYLFYVNV